MKLKICIIGVVCLINKPHLLLDRQRKKPMKEWKFASNFEKNRVNLTKTPRLYRLKRKTDILSEFFF